VKASKRQPDSHARALSSPATKPFQPVLSVAANAIIAQDATGRWQITIECQSREAFDAARQFDDALLRFRHSAQRADRTSVLVLETL